MKLTDALKTSLDELRMQMLGTQVLLGFQFQGLFQDNFATVGASGRAVDAAGMAFMVVALALMMAVPCQHRLVEGGETTPRIFKVSKRYAELALFPLACGIGCNLFVSVTLTIILLTAPAAIHRLTFDGRDDPVLARYDRDAKAFASGESSLDIIRKRFGRGCRLLDRFPR